MKEWISQTGELKLTMPNLALRLLTYQKERFPVAVHGLLIAAFSFSAIGFSRVSRGAEGFIPWQHYVLCLFSNLTIFFLLRVADEYKDNQSDIALRPYLPVPRGLVKLGELRNLAFVLLGIVLLANVWLVPQLLPFLMVSLLCLLLMRYEFFAGHWLNANMGWYMITHMFIIPLTDIYASSYDWRLAGVAPSSALVWFFGVSYLNGMVLEMGRKLRPIANEEPGVQTYTKLWGLKRGPLIWIGILTVNFILAIFAAQTAGHGPAILVALTVLYGLALLPGILFIKNPTTKTSKWIELMSILWAIGMYLGLGGIPQLIHSISPSH